MTPSFQALFDRRIILRFRAVIRGLDSFRRVVRWKMLQVVKKVRRRCGGYVSPEWELQVTPKRVVGGGFGAARTSGSVLLACRGCSNQCGRQDAARRIAALPNWCRPGE